MELTQIRERNVGEIVDEVSSTLNEDDYRAVSALESRLRERLMGIDERIATAALLMLVINNQAEQLFPTCCE